MARKKTAKRMGKRGTASSSFASTQKLEKDFLSAPAKLSIQLTKDIKSLKQRENKLKSAVSKVKTKVKNFESRLKNASLINSSVANKKQIHQAKKAHHENVKMHLSLNKQLDEISKSLAAAANKQAKIQALRKNLIQFEKQWAKDSKKIKKKIKKPTESTPKLISSTEILPQADSFETTQEEVRLEETTGIS